MNVSQGERWRFDSLTRDELTSTPGECTVVVPLGSTEQHGHHLPVRVDSAIVTDIAARSVASAAEHVRVLLAPTVPFGFAHHHIQFGGTISLGPLTYLAVLTDIATCLAREGFRRLVFLNGHGGNEAAMRLAADRLPYDIGLDIHVAATSYWTVAADALTGLGLTPPLVPGHAGHFETSAMLAIHPELVRMDARPTDADPATKLGHSDLDGALIRRPGLWEASDGRTDDARLSSAESGTVALRAIVDATADFLVRFHRSVSD